MKGKGFAIAGIVIGLIATVLWVVASSYLSTFVFDFREKSTQVTANVIQSGTDGEYDSCRSSFSSEYSDLSDGDIKSFADELQTRYGKFDSVILSLEQQSQELQSTQSEAVIPVQLVFETTDIYAETMLQVVPQSQFEFEFKLMCIKIFDSKNGDLVFPPDSPCK